MSKNIWVSADYHVWHSNILVHCSRPFASTLEMNEAIIANHNALVKPNDDFYHLGDFSWAGPDKTIEVLKRLNGKNKYMVRGNHDKVLENVSVAQHYKWLKDYYKLTIQDQGLKYKKQIIVLCHYPMRSWEQKNHNSFMLFGHCHSNLPDDAKLLSIDVGIDNFKYRPISYDEIKEIMKKRVEAWGK